MYYQNPNLIYVKTNVVKDSKSSHIFIRRTKKEELQNNILIYELGDKKVWLHKYTNNCA